MTDVKEETVDTSTNEEALETDVDTDLEDSEVSFDESDNDETQESDDSDGNEQASESTDEDTEESEGDEGDQSLDTDSKEEDTASEEDQKRHNAEMAQRRIAEKQARDAAKLDAQSEYLQAAKDDRDLALRQLQIDAYNNRVEGNVNKLTNGVERALADIDLFKTGTVEAKEALVDALDDFERMYIARDRNGDPLEVKGDVYQYLQAKADSIRKLTGVGARQESLDKAKQKARTMTPTSRAPKPVAKDPLLDGFDEEAGRW